MNNRTTYNLREDRKLKLERLAIEASSKTGKSIKWQKIVEKLIDDYAQDATKDLIHSTKKQQ